MEDEQLTVKQLIMSVLSKCKQALPQLALLTKKFDALNLLQEKKLRRKDCLNPVFLIRLSECGQNIRLILQNALTYDFQGKETLARLYNEYMHVIYDIRKYHKEAHLSHDMHKNSIPLKENLLAELREETRKREQAELQLQMVKEESRIREGRIRQLEEQIERGQREDDINISHISKFSGNGVGYGQLYGGESKVGRIDEQDTGGVESARLRGRIVELQRELEQREALHQRELQNQKVQILQLQSRFEQLVRSSSFESQTNKIQGGNTVKFQGGKQDHNQGEQMMRWLMMQAVTVQEFLNEGNND